MKIKNIVKHISNAKTAGQKSQVVPLPLGDIVPDPDQPRKSFATEELGSLARSLAQTGQLSAIVVRPGTGGRYITVVGERRWRAAKQAGMTHIGCIVRYDLDEQKAREMQFAENYEREDIPPLQQARGFRDYLETYKVSQSELSRRTGIPQRTISDRLALLSLPASVHASIEAGKIGRYEALKIARLPDDQQEAVAKAVASGEIGGRTLEGPIRQSPGKSNRQAKQAPQSAKVVEANMSLSQRLDNLEKAIYQLAATYTFNEAARQRGEKRRKAPPCPECLKRGDRGFICDIKRSMTLKDYREFIECMEDVTELSEEEKQELSEPKPTHIIEVKCHECGYTQFIGYAWNG
jgi:ParB family chromosome partitioning protein